MSSIALPNNVNSTNSSKLINYGLWTAQALLAVAFLGSGLMKLTTPLDQLAQSMPLAKDMPALVRFIGVSELAGAFGVLLPAATRIIPRLTVAAALGLTTVMVLAFGYHLMQGDVAHSPPSLVLGALSAWVAWGRTKQAPILAR
jgi:putative oxidoreductase